MTTLRKAPGDAEAYGQWVYAAAAKAAEASKEGGDLQVVLRVRV